jgi:predicted transcriptional regulator
MSLIQQTKNTVSTDENGVIKHEEKVNLINTRTESQKDFVYAFTKSIGYLSQLTKSEINTLFGMFKYTTMQNKIFVNKSMKQEISDDMHINFQTVENAITSLAKKGMIGRLDRGVYCLNPEFFGKGDFNNLKKIKIFQEFDFNERTQKVAIQQEFATEEERLAKELEETKAQMRKLEEQQTKLLKEQNKGNNLFAGQED